MKVITTKMSLSLLILLLTSVCNCDIDLIEHGNSNLGNYEQESQELHNEVVDKGDYLIVQGDIIINKSNPGYKKVVNFFLNKTKSKFKRSIGTKGNYLDDEGHILKWPDANPMILSYSFETDMTIGDFTNADVIATVRASLNEWEDVCNITFAEVSSNGQFTFSVANIAGLGVCHYNWWSSSYELFSAAITLDDGFTSLVRVQDTAMHEIGHGLGLGHEHARTDATSGVTWASDYQSGDGVEYGYYDSNSIMDYGRPRDATLTEHDIAAIRNLYGPDPNFDIVYESSNGIISYDMSSSSDKIKILDINNDGRDDIICYRPGHGYVYVGRSNGNGTFTNVYSSGNGIISYDMSSSADKIEILDFNNDGRDDIICYRPGHGYVYVGRSNGNGTFTNVYSSGNGIISYDMGSSADKIKILDFNNDGRDDIMCYRPGHGYVYVGRSNGNGTFTNVYSSGNGIISYDMGSSADKIKILDFNNDGRDDIMCYRPGHGYVYIGRSNGNGTFTNVYSSSNGIVGYDMSSSLDQIKILDFNNDGRDDIILYRPGHGYVYVGCSDGDGSYTNVYESSDGIIGYDMTSYLDQIIIFDYNNDNSSDIICYRPGHGYVYIGGSRW